MLPHDVTLVPSAGRRLGGLQKLYLAYNRPIRGIDEQLNPFAVAVECLESSAGAGQPAFLYLVALRFDLGFQCL